MYETSQPYKRGDTPNFTKYTYDGLGRTIAVTAADGHSTTTYNYFGNSVVAIDPAQKWKETTTDINGNLIGVVEPDPNGPNGPAGAPLSASACSSAPAGMLGTCYTYDGINNLTRVDMYRAGYDQVRTFTYSPAGTHWLQSATNPENGTVTYTRDSMGHVTQRVDAAGQITQYTYDPYYRLTQVTRQASGNSPVDSCQTENYSYDTSIGSFSSGSSLGLLTAVQFGQPGSNNVVCPSTASDSSTWGGVNYQYQYSPAGRVTGKRMAITRTPYWGGGPETVNLDAYWTYDNEGRMTGVTYPVVIDPVTNNPTNTAFAYTYDSMGRPSAMEPIVNGQPRQNTYPGVLSAAYNANNQVTSMTFGDTVITSGITETRNYNAMYQMTYLSYNWYTYSGPQSFSETYNFADNQNNGQITNVVEGTGETVTYGYDALKRLASASSSSGGWSQSYNYDGFGNMTSRSPGLSVLVNPATNWMVGVGRYDANGNLYLGNWSYDVENRLVSDDFGGGEQYMYDPSNKRIYLQEAGSQPIYYFFGVDGKVLGQYSLNWCCGSYGTLQLQRKTEWGYFAGKTVMPAVAHDRLGSPRGNASAAYYPYGENYVSPGPSDEGFATYHWGGATGLSYADQRYYSAAYGRFTSADRTTASVNPSTPSSWNRYVYSQDDPVNRNDPNGACDSGQYGEAGTDDDCTGDPRLPDPIASIDVYACPSGRSLMNNGTCDVPLNELATAIFNQVATYFDNISVGGYVTVQVDTNSATGITTLKYEAEGGDAASKGMSAGVSEGVIVTFDSQTGWERTVYGGVNGQSGDYQGGAGVEYNPITGEITSGYFIPITPTSGLFLHYATGVIGVYGGKPTSAFSGGLYLNLGGNGK